MQVPRITATVDSGSSIIQTRIIFLDVLYELYITNPGASSYAAIYGLRVCPTYGNSNPRCDQTSSLPHNVPLHLSKLWLFNPILSDGC